MKTYRTIEGTYRGTPSQMVGNGFRVSNYFPSGNKLQNRLSPFILLDYNSPYEFSPTSEPRGVGAHPHRGFETVTIAYEGYVEHHDNAGNHGVIGPGDVQWMTAGSGVLHKEYHEKSFAESGGVLHMIQLWVNLPKADKMSFPRYQTLLKDQMGKVDLPDQGGTVRIIAGEFEGIKGPAQTFTPVHLFDIRLREHGKVCFSQPPSYNTAVLILQGKIKINDTVHGSEGELILFKNEEGDILLEGTTNQAMVLVLGGEPIDEPMIQYGPFVMNSKEEIKQAYDDFQSGKFGSSDF